MQEQEQEQEQEPQWESLPVNYALRELEQTLNGRRGSKMWAVVWRHRGDPTARVWMRVWVAGNAHAVVESVHGSFAEAAVLAAVALGVPARVPVTTHREWAQRMSREECAKWKISG